MDNDACFKTLTIFFHGSSTTRRLQLEVANVCVPHSLANRATGMELINYMYFVCDSNTCFFCTERGSAYLNMKEMAGLWSCIKTGDRCGRKGAGRL